MQLLSNFMANWVGEKKKKKDKNYREQNYHPNSPPHSCSPRHPQPSLPAGGSLAPHSTRPARASQAFWLCRGLCNPLPPLPIPKPMPTPAATPSLGKAGARSPGAGTASPPEHLSHPCRYLAPPSPGSRDGVRSHRRCISRSILTRCPRPGKLITRLGGLRADSRRGSRTAQRGCGAAVPAAVIYLPLFLEPN